MRFAVIVLAGCSYAPHTAATDGPPACASTCQDAATLIDCETGQPVACPLGCRTEVAGDRCAQPVPSNGATTGDLDGATGDLIITADSTFDSATGAITVDNGPVLRTAGFGLSPENMRYTDLGNSVAVLGVHRLTIKPDATLRVAGVNAVIVLVSTDITIEGVLDASGGQIGCGLTSDRQCGGPGGGAGGGPAIAGAGCAGGGGGFDGSGDDTGGGGGGYGTPKGGDGASSGNPGGIGGAGNCSTTEVVPLVGGSGGGGGGGAGGVGGGGGGAIQLTALGNVFVRTPLSADRAGIRANGAGGAKGGSGDGGGGGGSAGAILLEGQSVTVTSATLAANGGGGGAGDNGGDGDNGRFDDQRAAGGTGARAGGDGAARSGTPGDATGTGDGTGGGGGGIGRIFINAADGFYKTEDNSIVSPLEFSGVPMTM